MLTDRREVRTSRPLLAVADLRDRHATTLESLLAVLRSPQLNDPSARRAAIELAGEALVDLRTEADERRQELLEPVTKAFARLKTDLRPIARFGELEVQFIEPPATGRALPDEVAQSARAIVRAAVLAFVDEATARRVRIQWDCDGMNLLINIRDDGSGQLHGHDDALTPIVQRVTALSGRIVVSSTPDWGTDLGISIPLDPAPAVPTADDTIGLSARERQILGHLASGSRNSEIAASIGVSPHTVKFHVSKLLHKAGARNRAELVALFR